MSTRNRLSFLIVFFAVFYSSPVLSAPSEWTDETAKQQAFSQAKMHIDVSAYPAKDPDFDENQRALADNKQRVADRFVTSNPRPPIGYVVSKMDKNGMQAITMFYKKNGEMTSLRLFSNAAYPRSAYIYCTENECEGEGRKYGRGDLLSAAFHVSDEEVYYFGADGKLNGHMHGENPYDPAIKKINTAMQSSPNDASLYNDRGIEYLYKNDLDKAQSDFTTAIKLDPSLARAYNNLGLLLAKNRHDFSGGIANLTKAIDLDPQMIDAYLSRGKAYMYTNQFEKAAADYSKVVELDPKNPDACYNTASLYLEIKNYDKAWEYYHKAKNLGANMDPEFVKELIKVSGRKE